MQFAKFDQAVLRYRVSGDRYGPWIVFVNSLGTDLTIWDDVIASLPAGYAVLCYDKRGHGFSSLPDGPITIDEHVSDLRQLMDHLEIKDAVICGVSVGGLIAQGLAARSPDRVTGLVLSNTGAQIGTAEIWNARISSITADGMEPMVDAILERWFRPEFRDAEPGKYFGYRRMLSQTPAAGYIATCAAIRDADLTATTSAIKKPTLCVAGDHDASTPPDLVERLANLIEGAQFHTIAMCGHIPSIEQPDAFAERLNTFLAQIDQTTRSVSGDTAGLNAIGMHMRRKVLGANYVDSATARSTELDSAFQRLITEGAWGSVWSSRHITLRDRSLITIALLAASSQDDELALHIRAARNTGISRQDIVEALLHVAVYCGVPKANHAIKIAKSILADTERGE